MPSIVHGYEYDVFISYRQKDNQSDRWVTNFVQALNEELDATFKEDISIYFDESPHDGLRDHHHVDDSLREKLKCVIFLPIISRTYCDPKSFAWIHEFLAFKKQANENELSLKVLLPGGNVASRILPVKIHELDQEDQAIIEQELDGPLRAINFIYKSSGVNRPLRASEDHPAGNLEKTYYRDQINKVANSIKEILDGVRGKTSDVRVEGTFQRHTDDSKKTNRKIFGYVAVVLFVLAAYYIYTTGGTEKQGSRTSIAIIPFLNNTGDENLNYFGIGLASEVSNDLSLTKQFEFVSSLQATMQYQNSDENPVQIGRSLGVTHIVTGMYEKSNDKLKVLVQLVDAKTGNISWSLTHNTTYNDLFVLQSQISKQVLHRFDIVMVNRDIPTTNLNAYSEYLKGIQMTNSNNFPSTLIRALPYFQKAIQLDSGFIEAWQGLIHNASKYDFFSGRIDTTYSEKNIRPFYDYVIKNIPESFQKDEIRGIWAYYVDRDFQSALHFCEMVLEIDPDAQWAHSIVGDIYRRTMQHQKAFKNRVDGVKTNPNSFNAWVSLGRVFHDNGDFDSWKKIIDHLYQMNPVMTNGWITQYSSATNSIDEIPQKMKESKGKTYIPELLMQQRNHKDLLVYLDTLQLDTFFTVTNKYAFKLYTFRHLQQDDSARYYANSLVKLVDEQKMQMLYNRYLAMRFAYATLGLKKKYDVLVDNGRISNDEDLVAKWDRLQHELNYHAWSGNYPEATKILKKMNNDFPHMGFYQWLSEPFYDRIKKEYQPFVDAVTQLKMPPKLSDINPLNF